MKGFKSAIESDALENTNFRKVLYTSEYSHLVLMGLPPGEGIGLETHKRNDQFFRVERGHGRCLIDGTEYTLRDGDAIVVSLGGPPQHY
jgi:mannose-6-phosphate isomerase-like protein (cupin superfamily)